jgi:hypothetical protein
MTLNGIRTIRVPDMKQETTRVRPHSGNNPETGLTVSLSIPKSIDVPLVNASVLSDYEAWIFVASVLANAVVGFLVAGLPNKDGSLLAITLMFSILFVVAIMMAFSKRRQMRKKTKRLTLRSR